MVIDFHTHVFPPRIIEFRKDILEKDLTFKTLYSNDSSSMITAPQLLESMNHSTIDYSVLLGIGWNNIDLAKKSNNYILNSASKQNRFVPFCSINPLWGNDAVKEIVRCAKLGAKGIGELHPDTQGFAIDDHKLMEPIMTTAKRLGMIVLTHASEPVGHTYAGKGQTTPDKLLRFIQNFPSNLIVCAHWGGGLPFYSLMPEVKKLMANTYFDSAASPFLYNSSIFQVIPTLISSSQILFGTDYPLLSQLRVLAQLENSSLSAENKNLIKAGNARKLLNIQ
jgi:predicted TIM-barrel fold metal-dependent hydrolase|tara:strand:+ start:704 stop:1543 length:840 start_codon:yes stop_codon:yes gene_type:complete